MKSFEFTGTLLRMLRVERNWSQEMLCHGICTVSYLSKIEQGRAQPNEDLLRRLFEKMDVVWQAISKEEGEKLCEELYEVVFADDMQAVEQHKEDGLLRQEGFGPGEWYLDYLVLRAYCCGDRGMIPEQMQFLLDDGKGVCFIWRRAIQRRPPGFIPVRLVFLNAEYLHTKKEITNIPWSSLCGPTTLPHKKDMRRSCYPVKYIWETFAVRFNPIPRGSRTTRSHCAWRGPWEIQKHLEKSNTEWLPLRCFTRISAKVFPSEGTITAGAVYFGPVL